ncbi:MAG: hypothetical protein PHV32_00525 [Eubacteriales bacterium]|nr:hypothetical protein [Eubacteriales bacterium]
MPNSIEITTWLYEQQYNALAKHLRAIGVESVNDEAEWLIFERYQQLVPKEEQDKIENELRENIAAEEKAAEEARRLSITKIITNGSARFFSSELLKDLRQNAISIRNFIRGETEPDYNSFSEYYESVDCHQEITPEDYDRCAQAFGTSPNVTGVFVFDFDTAVVSSLNSETGGYRRYAMKDVSTAAYHAQRKSSLAFWARDDYFYSQLVGKELPSEQETEQDDSPVISM